ncbi:uncharacterized protein LOC127847376 [Dreissena polymorpha]|uniref:B box-type domain-containing protein n=1 Tax=Dreissena polymorpha TaxID=45954 RepID=A0A9D4DEG9_DREPO|nr:uncharacterized protein LOC127847376 [Dreissena polymorpha]KAH3747854.1 hypothetical protein DPMN_182286 [Dreissena polymorpha]
MALCTHTARTCLTLRKKGTHHTTHEQVVPRHLQFLFYKDNRPCYKCISRGCIQDGENMCALCQEYMCISCTMEHSKECEHRERRVAACTPRITKHVAYMERQTRNRDAPRVATLDMPEHYSPNQTAEGKPERYSSLLLNGYQNGGNKSKKKTQNLSSTSSCSSEKPHFSGNNVTVRVGKSATSKQTSFCMACSAHVHMNIENYCKLHDALCCEECLHCGHDSCTVQPIDEVAHGIKDNTHMKDVMRQIAKIQNDCMMFVDRNEQLLDALDGLDLQQMRKTHHSVRMGDIRYVAKRFVTSGKFLETNVGLKLQDLEHAMRQGNDIEIFVLLKRNQQLIVDSMNKLHTFENEEKQMLTANDALLKLLPDQCVAVEKEKADSTIINNRKNETATETVDNSVDKSGNKDEINDDSDCEQSSEQNVVRTRNRETRPVANISGRSVSFKNDSRAASRASGNDRILKYGLVTEFYLEDMRGTEALDVVRLQSAPPERLLAADAVDQNSRPRSMHTVSHDHVTGGEIGKPERSVNIPQQLNRKDMLKSKLHMLQASRNSITAVNTKLTNPRVQEKKTVNEKKKPVNETYKTALSSSGFHERPCRLFKSPVTLEREMNDATPLIMKESSFIKAHSFDREPSMVDDKSRYNRQNYASRPRSKLLLTEEQIVRLPDEEMTCDINGIACMPDGKLIVSDFNNKSIKMFRTCCRNPTRLSLTDPPRGVTSISNTHIAAIVGLAHDRLFIINVGVDLKVHQRFKIGCMCKAITNFNSHIYLLCMYNFQGEIRIVSTDGVVNIRISLGHIITAPMFIAVNPFNGIVYVTDATRGVHAVETGKTVTRAFDLNVEHYHGVAVDINNTVYVCTENASGVQEVSYNWKHLMPVLLGYDGEGPKVVCYSAASNSLLMSAHCSETVQIYKILDQLTVSEK